MRVLKMRLRACHLEELGCSAELGTDDERWAGHREGGTTAHIQWHLRDGRNNFCGTSTFLLSRTSNHLPSGWCTRRCILNDYGQRFPCRE